MEYFTTQVQVSDRPHENIVIMLFVKQFYVLPVLSCFVYQLNCSRRCGSNFKNIISKFVRLNNSLRTRCEIAFRWISHYLINTVKKQIIIWANVDPDPCRPKTQLVNNVYQTYFRMNILPKTNKQTKKARRVHTLWAVQYRSSGAMHWGNAISNTESLEW